MYSLGYLTFNDSIHDPRHLKTGIVLVLHRLFSLQHFLCISLELSAPITTWHYDWIILAAN